MKRILMFALVAGVLAVTVASATTRIAHPRTHARQVAQVASAKTCTDPAHCNGGSCRLQGRSTGVTSAAMMRTASMVEAAGPANCPMSDPSSCPSWCRSQGRSAQARAERHDGKATAQAVVAVSH